MPAGWVEAPLEECVDILDAQRQPINSEERTQRVQGKSTGELFPYYGATGQVGMIDGFLFDEELVALGEDGVPFFEGDKHKAYMLRGKTWVNNHAHVLRGISEVLDNRILCHFLNQFDYRDYVNGGTRLKLTQANMRRIPLRIPPHAEQKRIAQKLDGLLAQVDTLKARIDAIPALLRRFRQAVLAAATSGQPTEKPITQDGTTWKLTTIGEVCSGSFYGPRFGKTEYTESEEGIPTIRTTDMTDDGRIIISPATPRVLVPTEKRSKFLAKKGDLLVTRTGSIGVMAVFDGDYEAIPSAYLIRFRFKPEIVPRYVFFCLMSPRGQASLGLSATAITQPNINAEAVKAIEIRIPSIEEQTKIICRVEQLFAYADQLEAKVVAAQQRIDALTQSLLAKAFLGELVPQDPTEEPASVLLERIRAQRAATPKPKRGRKKV
nr:restriction endonuclease subunit S [Xanthomonas cannabis]